MSRKSGFKFSSQSFQLFKSPRNPFADSVEIPDGPRYGPGGDAKVHQELVRSLDKQSEFDNLKLENDVHRRNFEAQINKTVLTSDKYRKDVYDINGMNLLHYCIWKDCHSTVEKIAEHKYDVNWPMFKAAIEPLTPMELILLKYKHKGHRKSTTHLMVPTLLNHGARIDSSYMNVAINFPSFLEHILKKSPDYYEFLPEKINKYYIISVSFFDLISRYSEAVFLNMIKKSSARFLKDYKDANGQTPLHSAAKYFRFSIVEELMKSRICTKCTSDERGSTPITVVLDKFDMLSAMKHNDLKTKKDDAIKVIATILQNIPEGDRFAAIEHEYHGMTAIEYDMKSGAGLIVQAIFTLQNQSKLHFLSGKYKSKNTLFHIAAKYGFSLKIFEDSLENYKDLLLEENDEKRKPFDYAVEYGHLKFIEEVCKSDENDDGDNLLAKDCWSHEVKSACKNGNLKALLFFHQYQGSFASIYKNKWELLHIACKHNYESIVKYFLTEVKMKPGDERVKGDRQIVPTLMVAVDSDAAESIELLLNYNFWALSDRDENGDNILCRAIKKGKKRAVMAILTHEAGKGLLEFCHLRDNTTPLRLLVQHMPDVAVWVLNEQLVKGENRQVSSVLNDQITKDKTSQEITYKYDLIDDADYSCHHKEFWYPLQRLSGYFNRRRLSRNHADIPMEDISQQNSPQFPDRRDISKPKYKPTDHMLFLMLQSESLDILKHQLVKNVIDYYCKYAWWYWIVLRVFYLLSTLLLTTFTLNLPHPKGDICVSNSTSGIEDGQRNFLFFSSSSLVLFSLVCLFVNAVTLYSIGLKEMILLTFTFERYRVFIETLLAVFVLLFVIGYYINDIDNWCARGFQWNLGAICTCLSWVTVLISLKGVPLTAGHVNMLFTIIKQFVKISFLPILLLFAFFIPFSMLFAAPWPAHIFGPLRDDESLNTLTTLLLGVFGNYVGPRDEEEFKDFPVASYLIFIGFVIIGTVLFNNLLIALAVGDRADLEGKADLEDYRTKVELIIDMLDLLYPIIKNKSKDVINENYKMELKKGDKKWEKEEMKWKNAEIYYENAMAYNKKLANLILKGTEEESIRNKIEILQKEVKELSTKLTAFQEDFKDETKPA